MSRPSITIIWLTIVEVMLVCLAGAERDGISATFTIEEGHDFSQLKYFPDYSTSEVYVGGRDALYRLNLSDLALLEHVAWKSDPSQVRVCQLKVLPSDSEECHNYVTVLLAGGPADSVLTCGTMSTSDGQCTWRKAGDLSQVTRTISGLKKTSKSKSNHVVAFVTENDQQFFGSNYGSFGSHLPVFSRHSPVKPTFVKTPDPGKNWLNEAEFVEIFENGPFIYVLLRERSVEYLEKEHERKPVYSRIARVCQNDIGSSTGGWTTFQKARLECPSKASGDPFQQKGAGTAFLFDQLQQAVLLGQDSSAPVGTTIAGIFNGPGNALYGAAICLYDMSAVQQVFRGLYQHQSQLNNTWSKTRNDLPAFNCEVDAKRGNHTVRDSQTINNYQLMYDSVQPRFRQAVVVEEMTLFRLLAAEEIRVDANPSIFVFYVLTDQNDIRKYVLDTSQPAITNACLVHVWTTLFEPLETVLTMTLIARENILLVGTSSRVMRISTLVCQRYLTQRQCMASGDPHCGWSASEQTCTDQQSPDWTRAELGVCSLENYLEPWDASEWTPCEDQYSKEQCLCRQRRCRSYKCSDLKEKGFQITNCSRDGGWTDFSEWTQCSGSCRTGLRSRTRSCTNPAPRFAGKNCEGADNETETCRLPDCPPPSRLRSLLPPSVVSPGGSQLQDWGPWGDCTKSCGGGIQRRARACMLNEAKTQCDSPQTEVRECGMDACPPVKKVSEWTRWMEAPASRQNTAVDSSTSEGFQEHGYRCVGVYDAAKYGDERIPLEITLEHEVRYCPTADSCPSSRQYDDALKAFWTPWSGCDETSVQYRHQNCRGSQQRVCERAGKDSDEDHPWGCWTDWSSCQNNTQRRHHTCLFDGKACTRGETRHDERICKDEFELAASSMAPPAGGWAYLVLASTVAFFAGMGVVGSVIFFRRQQESSAIQQRHMAQQNTYAATAGKPLMSGNGYYAHAVVPGMAETPEEDDPQEGSEHSAESNSANRLSRHYSIKSNGTRGQSALRQQESLRHKAKPDDSMYS